MNLDEQVTQRDREAATRGPHKPEAAVQICLPLPDLKTLQNLLKICRKQGVTDITLGDIIIKFGDLSGKTNQLVDDSDEIPTDEPTIEQLMFLSAPNHGGQ